MSASQPHLLILIADQHNASILGCAGDRVETPWLDRLAAAGTRFESCYCNHPLCVPSRMSFLTSRHSHELQVWGNNDSLSSNIPTFAHGLGAAGYRTVLVGRMHFIGGDQHHGFEERRLGDVSSGFIATNRAEYRDRGFFGCLEAVHNSGPGVAHDLIYDQAVAMEACRVIRDHDESGDPRPLCLVASFYSPHDPYRVYEEFYERYAENPDQPPVGMGGDVHPLPAAKAKPYAGVTAEQTARARAAYRGKTTFLDCQIGQIIRNWEASRLHDHDLTVYFSDHGDMLGEHGMWAKTVFYDASAKVPLIVAGAGIRQGVAPEVVSLLDLGPTLLDLAGAPALPGAGGHSLRPLLEGTAETWDYPVHAELSLGKTPARMVRQGDWKLNVYHGHEAELFNLAADPLEQVNLAKDPNCRERVAAMTDLVFADGWSPEAVCAIQAERQLGLAYIGSWVRAVAPHDPNQWGMPAPL